MGNKLVECPKCGQQNEAAVTCSKCGIDLAWAIEHWGEFVSGPQDYDAPIIVCADDDIAVLKLCEVILNRAGYRAATAHDAYEALDLIPRLMPDLIITDYSMPGMDGIELFRHLKASPTLQNIPVFILIAYGTIMVDMGVIETIRQGIEAGEMKCLTKPFAPRELISEVRSVLPPLPAQQ